ncbi:hypothetical protein EDB81DRAFT_411085 [Dactylonectria macrodidyma]|uniref:Uncharacterized protein n=1 Tax=Dactylonectria macrodidyma TaxID=307937 RepID=A0A9P9FAK8_9HYPO|nr:hypothetical protein EDB81DRAFT_411085 [Dactylonectria macrodidyma]
MLSLRSIDPIQRYPGQKPMPHHHKWTHASFTGHRRPQLRPSVLGGCIAPYCKITRHCATLYCGKPLGSDATHHPKEAKEKKKKKTEAASPLFLSSSPLPSVLPPSVHLSQPHLFSSSPPEGGALRFGNLVSPKLPSCCLLKMSILTWSRCESEDRLTQVEGVARSLGAVSGGFGGLFPLGFHLGLSVSPSLDSRLSLVPHFPLAPGVRSLAKNLHPAPR